MKYMVWKKEWLFWKDPIRNLKKKLKKLIILAQFWKEEREENEIPSDPDDDTKYEKSYEIISRNANFILVINGILLSFILTSQEKVLSNPSLRIPNLSVNTSMGSSYYVTSSPPPPISPFFFVLYTIIFGSIFVSMISSVGCFDTGLYARMGRSRSFQELRERESTALGHYRFSIISLFVAFIGLFNFNLATIVGESYWVYLFTFLSIITLLIAVGLFGTFSQFEDEEI